METIEKLQARIKDLEARLVESEERYRQVTDTIDEVFWMTDPGKGHMLFISPAYERIWGRTCQSLLEDPVSFLEAIHPDDRDRVIAAFPDQARGTYDIEFRIRRSDGELRWIHDRAFPVRDDAGNIHRIVGVARDVTEARENADRFRQVTDTIDEVFWMTDPGKGHMLFISPAYERIWGRTCQSLLEDPVSFLEAIHPDDRDLVIAAFPDQARGTYDIEFRIRRSDGELRWIHDRAFPVRDDAGNIHRIVGVAQDITENKKLMHDLEKEKRRSDRLLENILPLSIIEALKGSDKQPTDERAAPIIAQHIEQATVLFADLVGFTTFAGTHAAAYVVTQLNRIVHIFDGIAAQFGVEKIKTIGDCYMLAGGVPDPVPDHARRVAAAALAMKASLAELNGQENQNFVIRIGIHSGPLVAGVIGTHKYVYDLWGDTVNVASRMESSGLPGEIQVTEATRDLLGERFLCEARGPVSIKGKGATTTYLLGGVLRDS